MKPSQEWLESDIVEMIKNQAKENLNLDYKACAALAKTDGKKTEVSKDVSSFANSAGGVIIYGVSERDYLPIEIDSGFDPTEISKEWLENIINSNIHPKIDNLHINQIDLKSQGIGKVIYVVTIPQATFMAPHQAQDKRYYKRYNFQSAPMDDYEIKDILNRVRYPDLHLSFLVDSMNITFLPGENFSQPVDLTVAIENKSNEPAFYSVANIYFDEPIRIVNPDNIGGAIYNKADNRLQRNLLIPYSIPIFKSMKAAIFSEPIKILIPFENSTAGKTYHIRWDIAAHGMNNANFVYLFVKGNNLSVIVP
jgi:Putative DNA-binding domain